MNDHAPTTGKPRFPWRSTILSLVLGLIALIVLRTSGKVIRSDWFPFLAWIIVPGWLAVRLAVRRGDPTRMHLSRYVPYLAVTGLLLLMLVSSLVFHKWFYFLNWSPEGAAVGRSGLGRFALLTVLLIPVFLLRWKRPWILFVALLIGAEVLAIGELWVRTGGQALYRTDHPSFMFRLWEFARNFPELVTYMPHWNGGVLHYVSVTSGASGPGLLLWPLLRYFPVHDVYTAGWALLFLVIVPWVAYGSVRAAGGDRTAAAVGGILGLGVSQHFFLWALHFGTIGAAFASAMAMPVTALGFRLVWMRRRDWWLVPALVLSGFMLLMWAPGAIVGASVGLAVVCSGRRLNRKTVLTLALVGLAILAVYSPWLRVILGIGKGTVQFVMEADQAGHEAIRPSVGETFWSGWHHLVAHVQEANPVLICFGIVAVGAGLSRRLRRWFLPILIVLALVTGWAREFKPNSQLSRMSIPLFFVTVTPAAILVGRLLRLPDARLAAVRAGLTAILMLTGWNVKEICANRGLARYVVMDQEMRDVVDWIKAETPTDGRILFAGKCVHAYGGGNVAYLPVLTGREMMAVDYYGFPPEQVLYEYPPRAFRDSPESVWGFMDAYAVSHVITIHDNWKRYFDKQPNRYAQAATFGRIAIYKRLTAVSRVLNGLGQVEAEFNRLSVVLDNPEGEAVIAYNWDDALTVDPPAEIRPIEIVKGITLIQVNPHGRSPCIIRFNH
ncbi:MAG: hypothetical protein O3A51_00140 [Verrucomicrobia bacterium]|nr:hypothetical protein [Verrucomicrobiota bacterium]